MTTANDQTSDAKVNSSNFNDSGLIQRNGVISILFMALAGKRSLKNLIGYCHTFVEIQLTDETKIGDFADMSVSKYNVSCSEVMMDNLALIKVYHSRRNLKNKIL